MTSRLPNERVAIVANGEESMTQELIDSIKSSPAIIAVDGGLNLCINHGIKADYLVGDLDSIDESMIQFEEIKVEKYSRDKEMVDLECAISVAQKVYPSLIPVLFNVLGGRLDHQLNNLFLLLKYPNIRLASKVALTISEMADIAKILPADPPLSNEGEEVYLLTSEQPKLTLATCPGLTISLIPWLVPAKGVTTLGLKWNLKDQTLDENFLSISNIALYDSVSISITEGKLLCIVEKKVVDREMINYLPKGL